MPGAGDLGVLGPGDGAGERVGLVRRRDGVVGADQDERGQAQRAEEASAVGTIAGGFLAARSERNERVIALALGLAAVMALLLASGWVPSGLLLPLMAVMGFGVGSAGPNRDLLVRRAATSQFGKASFGRVYGFVYSGLDTGLALSPLIFGPLLDAGRFNAALTAVAVLQAASLLTAMRVGVSARARSAPREARV